MNNFSSRYIPIQQASRYEKFSDSLLPKGYEEFQVNLNVLILHQQVQ